MPKITSEDKAFLATLPPAQAQTVRQLLEKNPGVSAQALFNQRLLEELRDSKESRRGG